MRVRVLIAVFMLLSLCVAALAPFLAAHGETSLYVAFRGVCHQQHDRCLHLFGYPMALCARCVGIYLGVGLGGAFLPRIVERKILLLNLLASLGLTGVDKLLEFLNFYGDDFYLRSLAGFLFGISLAPFLFSALSELFASKKPDAKA